MERLFRGRGGSTPQYITLWRTRDVSRLQQGEGSRGLILGRFLCLLLLYKSVRTLILSLVGSKTHSPLKARQSEKFSNISSELGGGPLKGLEMQNE